MIEVFGLESGRKIRVFIYDDFERQKIYGYIVHEHLKILFIQENLAFFNASIEDMVIFVFCELSDYVFRRHSGGRITQGYLGVQPLLGVGPMLGVQPLWQKDEAKYWVVKCPDVKVMVKERAKEKVRVRRLEQVMR